MNAPFTLTRTETQAPTAALWLPLATTRELVEALIALGHEPWPRAYSLARGFLIVLDAPDSRVSAPGAIRLRALADHLFAPLDAQLGVALLDDERRALTKRAGLLLLPGEALEFDHAAPIPLSALLALPLTRQDWTPLPALPPRAERIESITVNFPDTPDDLLGQGGAGIGEQPPSTDDPSLKDKLKGQTSITAGRALAGLGKLFGLGGLTRKGAEMINNGLNAVPRLGEKFFGSQEAALRDLLRKFREGKLDDALKRAIPFNQQGSRGGVNTDSASLPFNNIFYSLGNILGGSERGPAGVWFAQEDVTAALMSEYRKAASEAAKKGDHRRAAFIYGKLLGDYREAANALMAGGLYHDAAQLYLLKLNDPLAAARAFESAGEIDKAVALYRERHEHVHAGELLMRAGEEDAAIGEFKTAAEYMVARGDFHAAGRLMLDRARRRELAREYFERGWREKAGANAPVCGQALLELFAEEEDTARLVAHVEEAARFYGPDGHQAHAGRFFNRLAELASRKNLAAIAPNLRDRALVALAAKLRQRAGYVSGNAVSETFGAGLWAPALVNDARAAVRREGEKLRELPVKPVSATHLRLGNGRVTALCFAQHTDEVFAGFETGEVVTLRPTDGAVLTLARRDGPVLGLAVTQDGDALFVLREGTETRTEHRSSLARQGSRFEEESPAKVIASESMLLAAACLVQDTWSIYGSVGGLGIKQGLPGTQVTFLKPATETAFAAAIIEPTFRRLDATLALLTLNFSDDSVRYFPSITEDEKDSAVLGWHPALPFAAPIRGAPISHLRTDHDELELCGTNARGYVFWSRLTLSESRIESVETKLCGPRQEYRCAALTRGGHVAAIAESRVDLFTRQGNEMALKQSIKADLRGALAAHYAKITEELLIVCEDGRLVRVPL
jgi:tetratricopeptide (TPR) repeat protein